MALARAEAALGAAMAVVKQEPVEAPGTPRRQRRLEKDFSDPKVPFGVKRLPEASQEPASKRPRGPPPRYTEYQQDLSKDAEYKEVVDGIYGVSDEARGKILLQLRRWGPSRLKQILALWTALGDARQRPVTFPALQVWGRAGTGKTEIVRSYLEETGLRHVYLDTAAFSSLGELKAGIAEEIRRVAVAASTAAPREVQEPIFPGRQLRSLDRLEAALRAPLEHLAAAAARAEGSCGAGSDKVVVVIDHAQELPKLNPAAVDLLLGLPQALVRGHQLAFVFISRLPLVQLGSLSIREPAGIKFQPYTVAEAQTVLHRALVTWLHSDELDNDAVIMPSDEELRNLVSNGLLKFAAPIVGTNMKELLFIGTNVLRAGIGDSLATLRRQVEAQLQKLHGLPDMSGFLGSEETTCKETASTTSAMRDLTKAEKRMILTTYIVSRVDKDDDVQLFLPQGHSRRRLRRGTVCKKRPNGEDGPAFLRPPKPVPLPRLLAVYHRLAQQSERRSLLGQPLLEMLMNLCDMGLLGFVGGRHVAVDRDPKIVSTVELPMASACASALGVDLAEYLCNTG